jgi:hypothetical protein
MKICSDCHQNLPFSDFIVRPRNKDGHDVRCKKCRYLRYNKEDPVKVLKIIYTAQIHHSIARGHPLPNYTLRELADWIESQPHALELWRNWENSGYQEKIKPSIDRLDNSLPYTLDNIQLVTWSENRKNGAEHKKSGKLLTTHKSVAAFYKDGTHYRSYISIHEAMRDLGVNSMWGITTVANGEPVKDGRGKNYVPKTYKGLIWKWV